MKIRLYKREKTSSGAVLMEVAAGFALLVVVALMLMKLSMLALANRSWIVRQTLSDAYCSREIAYAKRIPFDALIGNASPWPTGIANASEVEVTMGKLAIVDGAQVSVTGKLKRFKEPMDNNLATQGGTGDDSTNPAAINSLLVQSVLTYEINGKTYYKTRSAIRTQ